MFKNFNF